MPDCVAFVAFFMGILLYYSEAGAFGTLILSVQNCAAYVFTHTGEGLIDFFFRFPDNMDTRY